MNEFITILLTQLGAGVIGFLIPAVLLRGFLWKFIKVKTSFGKLVLVKILETGHNHFAVGEIKEGWLIFQKKVDKKKENVRLKIPRDKPVLYRQWNITCVDIESETGALMSVTLDGIEGFDQIKFEDLYERALFKPSESDPLTKIILFGVVISALASIVSLFLVYNMSVKVDTILSTTQTLVERINSGTIVGGGNL